MIILNGAEKRKLETTTKLTRELENAKTELSATINKLGTVEEERLEGMAKIEASQKRVQKLEAQIENDRKRTDDEIASRIASFQKFEEAFREKEAPFLDIICG